MSYAILSRGLSPGLRRLSPNRSILTGSLKNDVLSCVLWMVANLKTT